MDDTNLLLTIVRAIIAKVEAINPWKKGSKQLLDELFDELRETLLALKGQEELAKGFKLGKKGAARDLHSAAKAVAPFAHFMSTASGDYSGETPGGLDEKVAARDLHSAAKAVAPFAHFMSTASGGYAGEFPGGLEKFLSSVDDDCTEIARTGGVAAMDAPSGFDFDMDEPTPAEISWYKWTLLVILYAIEFGLLYGTMVTIWNLVRALGGVSFKDPLRIASEIGAAILVAMTVPEFQTLLRHILGRARLAVDFEGEVDTGKAHVEMVCTGILGGESIDMGIEVAMAIAGDNLAKVKYTAFLGNFMAFFAAGLINAAGQVAVGRKLVIGPRAEPWPSNAVEAFKLLGGRYIDMDIALYQRLMHALNWGCYEVYGGGLVLLANGAGGKRVALAGSLWIFVTGFKVSFFWAGKVQAKRAARITEA